MGVLRVAGLVGKQRASIGIDAAVYTLGLRRVDAKQAGKHQQWQQRSGLRRVVHVRKYPPSR